MFVLKHPSTKDIESMQFRLTGDLFSVSVRIWDAFINLYDCVKYLGTWSITSNHHDDLILIIFSYVIYKARNTKMDSFKWKHFDAFRSAIFGSLTNLNMFLT